MQRSGPLATLIKSAICKTSVRPRPQPSLFVFPGLGAKPVHDPRDFPQLAALEDNYEAIKEEYLALRRAKLPSDFDTSKDEHRLHEGRWDWNSYVLKGVRQAQFAAMCPRTVEILESVPRFMTGTPFSFAFFSTLSAGATIAPHTAPCNIRLRVHFPLTVPKGDCGLEVGGKRLTWEEGRCLVFDDAYEHQVWNNTDEERVVLLFDLWHPELHADEIAAITDMFNFARDQGWLKQ